MSLSEFFTFCLVAISALASGVIAQESPRDPGAPAEAIARWRDTKFGLFIHWGPVSLKGVEIGWGRGGERRGHSDGATGPVPGEIYDNLYKEFNPVKFDPDEWVEIARAAGMRYMVFTTKHHDGFCNFDSKLTDFRSRVLNPPIARISSGNWPTPATKEGLP